MSSAAPPFDVQRSTFNVRRLPTDPPPLYRVVGQTTYNSPPGSFCLDPCPTRVVSYSKEMPEQEAAAHLQKCRRVAPSWSFELQPASTPIPPGRSPWKNS